MTLDLETIRRRRKLMMTVNLLAALTALGAVFGYFQLGLGWALIVFAAAIVGGLATQIWFVSGLRDRNKGT